MLFMSLFNIQLQVTVKTNPSQIHTVILLMMFYFTMHIMIK